ncbi:hypothetical protein CEUSTIGMA_g5216.t1 [Chlamydomonas eustigma]|uniref:Reverse transcriptase Ty1/copia-type domain-containing protein n=1 Tax=Chlamydomonas eustigma TaxID=1157962 RepID=A0A250X3W9_9CHLO|nr:hypothetical protein CEUSTIGMA_g5216.t1 [Chlamydomonas eustigma]|eukprot:GAX77773.1 hypothetical protein CEUSTIGMA_g5216.t1 [Chlamydomonas eustigma]
MGIVYGSKEIVDMVGYCDADYAGDMDTRRSTTVTTGCYVLSMHGGAMSWSSRLQPTVAMSSCEAEYMSAASAAVKEALWLRKLAADLNLEVKTLNMYCDNLDNQGSIKLLKHPIASARSKHIDVMLVMHHFVRERVARGEVQFEYCSTERMVADIFTKALPVTKLEFCRQGLAGLPIDTWEPMRSLTKLTAFKDFLSSPTWSTFVQTPAYLSFARLYKTKIPKVVHFAVLDDAT